MKPPPEPKDLSRVRAHIARRVRELRRARRLTQAEVAARLGLSQNRLSEVEHGKGSFTAEQFVVLQQLFNVTGHDLAGIARDVPADLQNALARLGAEHLQETESLPSERLEDAHEAIREAVIEGSPRLLTAIAPVLVRHGSELNLYRIDVELEKIGLQRRFGWVVANTSAAVAWLRHRDPRRHARLRNAEANLQSYLAFHDSDVARTRRTGAPLDILDRSIRTGDSVREVQGQSSELSTEWGIVTTIQTKDFVAAIEAAGAHD